MHLKWWVDIAYQKSGVSQASSAGEKPAGVESAVAMREVADIETGRFALVALAWEQLFVDIARVMVDISRDLYLNKKDELSVSYVDSRNKRVSQIKWKDVDLEDNPFDISVFPVSNLPSSPTGRIQTISEYIQNQWISKERGMELMNLDPDLEGEVNIQTASLRLTEKWLSEMVEDGIYHRPEKFMNLPLVQSVSQGVYQQLLIDNCPDDRLDLVRRFIDETAGLISPPKQQQPQASPQGPQAPQPQMTAPPQGPVQPQTQQPS